LYIKLLKFFMKKLSYTYRFIALFMAAIVFLSAVGIALDTHVCQDKLKSVSLLGKAKNCYELAGFDSPQTCSKHKNNKVTTSTADCNLEKKDCCNDQFHYFQSDIDFQTQTVDLDITPQIQQFVIAFVAVFFLDNLSDNPIITSNYYKPPLILKDIPVLVQSFLL